MKSAAGLLLAAGVLALFGCGGGDSSGSSLTKAEFIKQANQTCRQEAKVRVQAKAAKERELDLEPGEIANPAQHKKIVDAALTPYEKVTDQLVELVPSDQADTVEPFIEAREELAEIVRYGTNEAAITLPAIKKADDLAREFGLDDCSI